MIANPGRSTRDEEERTLLRLLLKEIEVELYGVWFTIQPTIVSDYSKLKIDSDGPFTSEKQLDPIENTYEDVIYDDDIKSDIYYIDLSPMILCPYVEIGPSHFDVDHDLNGSPSLQEVKLIFNRQSKVINETDQLNKILLSEDGQLLRVCVEVLGEPFQYEEIHTNTGQGNIARCFGI